MKTLQTFTYPLGSDRTQMPQNGRQGPSSVSPEPVFPAPPPAIPSYRSCAQAIGMAKIRMPLYSLCLGIASSVIYAGKAHSSFNSNVTLDSKGRHSLVQLCASLRIRTACNLLSLPDIFN